MATVNPLDLAIEGNGYFKVTLPNGSDGYTRAGAFQLSPAGEIVNVDGYTIAPGITIPAEAIDISVNATGEVLIKLEGQTDMQNVGQLELTNFPNEAGLESIGDNIFLETPSSGSAAAGTPGSPAYGTIMQGFIETSNVNPVSEITSLITAQRAYELNSKVITTSDEMMRSINTLR